MSAAWSDKERLLLTEMALLVDQALDLPQVLDRVLAVLSRALPGRWAEVAWLDPARGQLLRRALDGPAAPEPGPDPAAELYARVMHGGRPFLAAGPLWAVPLFLHGSAAGVLAVEAQGQEAAPEQRRVLGAAGEMLSRLLHLHRRIQARLAPLQGPPGEPSGQEAAEASHLLLEGQSQAMAQVQELLHKVAPSEASVLLLGPLGSGKAQAAGLIHRLSPRADRPLLRLDCAFVSQEVSERRLFGYEKGAFSGATEPRAGLLERAQGGSLFMTDITSLGPPLQAKLLRVLQERQYERLGGSQTRSSQARILAASRQDLAAAVEQGQFRQDLYYRLNVFPITLPPLARRREDIPLLVRFFLERAAAAVGRRLSLNQQALDVLTHYAWPGNVAELENLCQRLALLTQGDAVTLADLPSFVFQREAKEPSQRAGALSRLEEMERRAVVAALERNQWVQSHAAAELGLTLRQIGYRIKKFGLEGAIRRGRGQAPEART
ncbi:MAG: AAA family ATPase [Desulfarculus sp.]|nr:MAG: AAA family ATPase [Desulfarculus sp.]